MLHQQAMDILILQVLFRQSSRLDTDFCEKAYLLPNIALKKRIGIDTYQGFRIVHPQDYGRNHRSEWYLDVIPKFFSIPPTVPCCA